MESRTIYQRQVAIKIMIQELLEGRYVQEEEGLPNYLLTINQQKIYRLNLMAAILQKEKFGTITNFVLDDGSGNITMRSFEEDRQLEQLKVGTIIRVIGKLRSYNQERYISPEIVKTVNPAWLKVRAAEMKEKLAKEKEIFSERAEPELVEEIAEEYELEEKKENGDVEVLPIQKVTKLIQELDHGEGVLMEEIISKSPVNNTEQLLERMLESGEIFQNSPGKVKVL